jgi:hypothetical protein
MSRERWFRGGHDGQERPFDWRALARRHGVEEQEARELYEEAVRQASARAEPRLHQESIYLELLARAGRPAWRPTPGKVTRTMRREAERRGEKRRRSHVSLLSGQPIAPGKSTLTSYLTPVTLAPRAAHDDGEVAPATRTTPARYEERQPGHAAIEWPSGRTSTPARHTTILRRATVPAPAGRTSRDDAPADALDEILDHDGGQPLPEDIRARLEQRFGVRMDDVRVHTDDLADLAALGAFARALTVGAHIYFGRGEYDPASASGWELLVHEVTHVVQWKQGRVPRPDRDAPAVSDPADALEREAEAVARTAAAPAPGPHDQPMAWQARDAPAPAARPPAARIQRAPRTEAGEGETPLARAIRTNDVGDIKAVEDFRAATEDQRMKFVDALLAQYWVGPRDEAALERVWGSFGDAVLEVAAGQRDRWDKSVEAGAELDDLPGVARIQAAFRADVCALARETLSRNEAHVLAEMQALGIPESGALDAELAPMQQDYLADMRGMAEQILAARAILAELRRVPVGYRVNHYRETISKVVVTFDPDRRPPLGPDSETAGQGARQDMRTWDEVKAHHDRVSAVMAALAADSPALYAAVSRDDDEALASMAQARPDEARQTMAGSLRTLLENIRATHPKIGTDLDDRDLTPLHEQLFHGQPAASGANWSEPLHQWAARDLLEDHESTEFWITLGLSTLAAAAFIVVEIGTLGLGGLVLAAGVGVGATGTLVGQSWEEYEDLSTAANAGASSEGQIVTQGQARAALVEATLNTAFAFLDVIPAVKAGRTLATARRAGSAITHEGIEQGVKHGAEEGLENGAGQGVKHGAEEGLEDGADQGVKHGAEEGLEDGAGQGAGTLGDAGNGGAAGTGKRLRPEEADNWSLIEQRYRDKKIDDLVKSNDIPPGYAVYERGGKRFLRRLVEDDKRFARLTVEDGVVKAGRARSPRLSNARQVNESINRSLARQGLTRPANHQAHHLVPDEVVRKHPLLGAAQKKKLFQIDDEANLVLLARDQAAKDAAEEAGYSLSRALPTHSGSHPTYSDFIYRQADLVWQKLMTKHGYRDIQQVPDEVLREATQEIQEFAHDLLDDWMLEQGARLF